MMNGRHQPAGQGMQPDMGRRRPYHQAPQFAPVPMYNGYMNPYQPNIYPQQLPPQYPTTTLPHQYGLYSPYGRSPPPPMQHYMHPAAIPQHQYQRPQHSPAISAPMPFPQHVAAPTPSSTQSSHALPVAVTPPVSSKVHPTIPPPASPPIVQAPRAPFKAPLPWFSAPEAPWPTRRIRRRKKQASKLHTDSVELPSIQQSVNVEPSSETITAARPETPSTNHPASDATDSTNPTTPSSAIQPSASAAGDATPVVSKATARSNAPVKPIVPVIHKTLPKESPTQASHNEAYAVQEPAASIQEEITSVAEPGQDILIEEIAQETQAPAPKAWTTPKSWTGLFTSGATPASDSAQASATGSLGKAGTESLAEALRSFNAVSSESKAIFLEPRGLINTGNMCYMNSVLQVLVFCPPFYDFLDQVSKRAAYSFKSETPLIDAMIMFMREYKVIDSAGSVEKLRLRLKTGELEQYGEPFTPEFVYDAISRLPRFSSMRQGHQQDAEEFLGFLLEGLHDECVQVMQSVPSTTPSTNETPTNGPSSPTSELDGTDSKSVENGWLEVGPKQKAAITRSSGTIVTGSPVTKIFGGDLRSELRVPGLKDSVTLEPYQPLQLDIGSPNINNIVDALKGLTRSEVLHGDFKSPKGPNVTATKQVFIETVPPVLILHLKRFQYDNAGGTQKIWKKVGYPLELEIPKEVFPRQTRTVYAHGGLPKYRLVSVVYHHGKNASGGHYTVDVRRQDGREWIRLDDTVIKRVRSEDVAEGGSEEDPKILSAALEAHKKINSTSGNIYSSIDDDDDEAAGEAGWKQANGSSKKWSSVVNGASTPTASTPKGRSDRSSVKDNKVAYLLFYQRI